MLTLRSVTKNKKVWSDPLSCSVKLRVKNDKTSSTTIAKQSFINVLVYEMTKHTFECSVL